MTDIPSCSFGRNLAWFCKKYTDLLKFFNKNPPLSNQASWTLFIRSNSASMKFLSVLRMQHFETGKWLRLKKAGKHIGKIGVPLSDLWEWSLGYRISRTRSGLGDSQASQLAYDWDAMVKGKNLKLAQSLERSRPLAGRSIWPMKEILKNLKTKKL